MPIKSNHWFASLWIFALLPFWNFYQQVIEQRYCRIQSFPDRVAFWGGGGNNLVKIAKKCMNITKSTFLGQSSGGRGARKPCNKDLSDYVIPCRSFDESFNFHKQLLRNWKNNNCKWKQEIAEKYTCPKGYCNKILCKYLAGKDM